MAVALLQRVFPVATSNLAKIHPTYAISVLKYRNDIIHPLLVVPYIVVAIVRHGYRQQWPDDRCQLHWRSEGLIVNSEIEPKW